MFAVDFTNPFIIIFLCGSILSFLIKHFLEYVDYSARKRNGGTVPEALQDVPAAKELLDTEKLKKICAYENAKYFTWIISSICEFVLTLSLVLFGFYPFVYNLVIKITSIPATISSGFVCFFLFAVISSIPEELLSLPFSIYKEFVLEKKFEFSKMTPKLFITDFMKNLILSMILMALLCLAASVFFVKCPKSWWFILAAILICLTFLMQIIYPKFIAPLFNKFVPLEDGELKDKINQVLEKIGFANGGLFVMDESKRSGHSNAYFSGFGKTKRIVLYDTLIKSLTTEELVSVLGHELGHFKLKHITKRLFVLIPMEFLLLFVLYFLAQNLSLYSGFGFATVNPSNISSVQFLGLFLAVLIYGSVSEILSPVINFSSRKDEYQADAFACKIVGSSQDLISALVKLNSENLSELLPPKIYVVWNYSHPSLVERVTALKRI